MKKVILKKQLIYISIAIIVFGFIYFFVLFFRNRQPINKIRSQLQSENWKPVQRQFTYSTTKDWVNFSQLSDEKPVSFLVPPEWALVDNTHIEPDEGGMTIIELSPGLILLHQGQACFNGLNLDPKSTTQTNFSYGPNHGVLRDVVSEYLEHTYYSTLYCVKRGDKAFQFSLFFSDNPSYRKNTEDMISTLRF